MQKINIQLWHDKARVWSDCKATQHEVENPTAFAQQMANDNVTAVRMTYPLNGVKDISALNGNYFHPRPRHSYFPF